MAPPTLMTANRWDDTPVNRDRYCCTSLLDPTDESVCTIMPLVLRSVGLAGDEEKHRWRRAAPATGRARDLVGSRRTDRRAPARRATAHAEIILAAQEIDGENIAAETDQETVRRNWRREGRDEDETGRPGVLDGDCVFGATKSWQVGSTQRCLGELRGHR